MNYIDYFIIGFIIVYSLWGLSKGIIRIALAFAGYIVAIIVAKLSSPYLIQYVNSSSLYEKIQLRILDSFNSLDPTMSQNMKTLKIPSNMTNLINQDPELIDLLKDYPALMETIENNITKLSGQSIIDVFTDYVILFLCFLTIFLITKIIFSIIVSIIISRNENMPLAFTNRILGLLLATLSSIFILSFILQVSEVFSVTTSNVLSNAILKSKYGHLFINLPIIEWVSNFIN